MLVGRAERQVARGVVGERDHGAAANRALDDAVEDGAAGRAVRPDERVDAGVPNHRQHVVGIVGPAGDADPLPVGRHRDVDVVRLGVEVGVEALANRRRRVHHVEAGVEQAAGERGAVDAADANPGHSRRLRSPAKRTRASTVGPSVNSTTVGSPSASSSTRAPSTYAPHVSKRTNPRMSSLCVNRST